MGENSGSAKQLFNMVIKPIKFKKSKDEFHLCFFIIYILENID
jgi:hypothetical protein